MEMRTFLDKRTQDYRTVHRIDAPGRLEVTRSPEGFLRTSGKLAKPGVMTYRRADGTTIRELVEAEVLSDAVSNESLEGKALTIEHPPEDVTPDNWQGYAHGVWSGATFHSDASQGPGLYAVVTAHTRTLLDLLDDPEGPRELSPGYTVQVDDTPGEHPEYGPYDTRQIPGTRRYNHGALTRQARGGPDLTIRRDSLAVEVEMMDTDAPLEEPRQDADAPPEDDKKMDMAALKKLEDRMSALEGKEKADEEDEEDEKDPMDLLSELLDRMDRYEKSKKEDSADRLAWFSRRKSLEDLAHRYGVRTDGVPDEELKVAIVQTARPDVTRTDSAYIDAALDFISSGPDLGGLGAALVRQDAEEQYDDPQDLFFSGLKKSRS